MVKSQYANLGNQRAEGFILSPLPEAAEERAGLAYAAV